LSDVDDNDSVIITDIFANFMGIACAASRLFCV